MLIYFSDPTGREFAIDPRERSVIKKFEAVRDGTIIHYWDGTFDHAVQPLEVFKLQYEAIVGALPMLSGGDR